MMNSVKHLNGSALSATDGAIGHVTDVYFDDEAWALRYLVVNTGQLLSTHEVLISPNAVTRQPAPEDKKIDVALTRDQIEHSPSIDTHQPISRRHELEFMRYYGYPVYWETETVWAMNTVPVIPPDLPRHDVEREAPPEDRHLRSCAHVKGYAIHAADGTIGHVADFVFDENSWTIRYLVVDTRNWWPGGRKVRLATSSIRRIDWADRGVHVQLTREEVRACPEHADEELGAQPTRPFQVDDYLDD